MSTCKHETLTLTRVKNNRLRCRHCHLTISEEELGSGCCPECLEVHNIRHRDFEKVTRADSARTIYCCDKCGMIVEC